MTLPCPCLTYGQNYEIISGEQGSSCMQCCGYCCMVSILPIIAVSKSKSWFPLLGFIWTLSHDYDDILAIKLLQQSRQRFSRDLVMPDLIGILELWQETVQSHPSQTAVWLKFLDKTSLARASQKGNVMEMQMSLIRDHLEIQQERDRKHHVAPLLWVALCLQ